MLNQRATSPMNKLVRDPAPRFVPTKFYHDPIRTAPVRALTVWGNAHPPSRQRQYPSSPIRAEGKNCTLARRIDRSHKCGWPWQLVAKSWGIITDRQMCYMFVNIKHNTFPSMLHIPTLWYFDISEIYPHGFRRVKFVIIPPCFG